ncbi:MAG: MgtC/SapB family protein [Clostridia bacterium]|nr:MgtC/SapB family protein [Clostridia bacterium]
MDAIIAYLRDFNLVTVIIRLLLSAILGGIIGLERGRQRRAAGLRTHILVCIGAALTAMVGFFARDVFGLINSDPLRVSAQVISGIGFLGVGTIMLKGRFQVIGLTTAAGLWVTAAIGLSLGAGFYEGAIVAFAVSVFTVMVLNKIERYINEHRSFFGVYIEIDTDLDVKPCIAFLKENYQAHDIQVTLPRSGVSGNVGIEVSIFTDKKSGDTLESVIAELQENSYVVFATESL